MPAKAIGGGEAMVSERGEGAVLVDLRMCSGETCGS